MNGGGGVPQVNLVHDGIKLTFTNQSAVHSVINVL
jgi:hypothetical protein